MHSTLSNMPGFLYNISSFKTPMKPGTVKMFKCLLNLNLILQIAFSLRVSKPNYLGYTGETPTVLQNDKNYTSLYILDSDITILQPPYLSSLGNVEELVIANARNLQEIRAGVLNNSQLKKLRVNVSKLRKISNEALDNIPNLNEVSFVYGRLRKLSSSWFKNSSKVEEFHLSHNRIQSLTRAVFRNIYNVKYLSLDNNRIRFVCPHAFWNLLQLETVVLTNNRIQTIDKVTFVNLPRLAALDLSRNELTCLEDDVLVSMGNVKEVWLSEERLTRSCSLKLRRYHRNFRLVKL